MAVRPRRVSPAPPELVEVDWSRGMVRDAARDALPAGSVWDSVDYLIDRPGMLYKRGGSSYYGPQIPGAGPGPGPVSAYGVGVGFVPFPSSTILPGDTVPLEGQLVLVDGVAGNGYRITPSTETLIGAMGSPTLDLRSNPVFVVNGVVTMGGVNQGALIVAGQWRADGVVDHVKMLTWTGTAIVSTDLPPVRSPCAANYKGRLVVAIRQPTVDSPANTLQWAPATDITAAYDPLAQIAADYEITGLAALQNALLVFSHGHTERVIGSDPPPDTDMEHGVIGDVGCSDARSIAVHDNTAIFANPNGVYRCNGAGFESLTGAGGIQSYWTELFTNYNPDSWRVAGGVLGDHYIVSITGPGRTFIDSLICNIPRRAWGRLGNVSASMFAPSSGAKQELYYSELTSLRIVRLSEMFTPGGGNAIDANGIAVEPDVELRILGTGPTVKTFGFARLTYAMSDPSASNPQLIVSAAKGPTEPALFTALPESPLPETTTAAPAARPRLTVNRRAQGVILKINQQNASSFTELYALEVEQFPLLGGGL